MEIPDVIPSKPKGRKSSVPRRFDVHANYRSALLGIEFENEDRLRGKMLIVAADPWNRGFPAYPESPRFRHDKREGCLPRDFEDYRGYWLVSARMKGLLETIDPEAFAFVRCDLYLGDGTPGPDLWLCDVIRVLDALDPAASNVDIRIDGGRKIYLLHTGDSLVFHDEVVGDAHVFRIGHFPARVVCDETFRAACKAEKMKNIEFGEVTKRK